ncbi:MAG: TRAP transporter small permease, partial [Burkholderiales bacterium]
RAGAVMESVFLLVGAVMFSLVIWAIWPTFIRAVTRSEFFGVEGVFTFPTWPIRLIIVVGSAAAVLAYLLQIGQLLRNAYAPPAGHLESKVAP